MAKPKIPNQKSKYKALNARLNKYTLLTQAAVTTFITEAVNSLYMVDYDGTEAFSFDSNPITKGQLAEKRSNFISRMFGLFLTGTALEWAESNKVQDTVADKVLAAYGGKKIGTYYQDNNEKLAAFQSRVYSGRTTYDRLGEIADTMQKEVEAAISVCGGSSVPVVQTKVEQYFSDVNSLRKDFKQKFGYEPHVQDSQYQTSRLLRSEINMAYRTAEHERWMQMDFVVGYEIKLSAMHSARMPHGDICDTLAGKYPKWFKWSGWHPNCYSDDSEVLTNKGWKLFKDVLKDDSILSLNPKTKNVEWVGIADIQIRKYNGSMVHFFNKSLDCLVTPEHQMVYINKNDGRIKTCYAKEYRQGKGGFYRGCQYIGEDIESINIECVEYDFDIYCEFMGYYLSDGCLQHGTGICIAQKDGERSKPIVLECLRKMGFRAKVKFDRIDFYNSAINRHLAKFGISHTKYIPENIKKASKRQIQIFLDAYILCDGHITNPKGKYFIGNRGNLFVPKQPIKTYFTTSQQMAADLSELILKVGHRPAFSKNNAGCSHVYNGKIIKSNYDCWNIRECVSTTSTVFNKETVDYDGYVYDLTLQDNHIMYIRRNGKCFWGSNCHDYCIPVLKTEDEFFNDLPSQNEVCDVPLAMRNWIERNSDYIARCEKMGTTPYLLKDNDYKQFTKFNDRAEQYYSLKDNPEYKDVFLDPQNGGLKATHIQHNFDKVGGIYELHVQDVGYKAGHSVVFGKEREGGFGQRFTEGLFDGKAFEIAGRENPANNNNILAGLKHCASKRTTQIAVLDYPVGGFNIEAMERALKRYRGLEKLNDGQYLKFERIICIEGGKIVYNVDF